MDLTRADLLFSGLPEPARSPGFSVLAQRGRETLYEQATGFASLEYGLPNTRQTVFHTASVSKQFTALCVTLLEEEGKADLSASVRRYFPELPACMEPVTPRHLLHHTGGLREQWDLFTLSGSSMEDLAAPDQTLRALMRQTRLNFAPGERYQYCNSGYILLALLVERLTGRTLRQFARERVFKPLGMDSSYFRDDHGEICYDRAESYDWVRDRYVHRTLTFDLAGNTSLNTTPRDLCRWLDELAAPRVLSPAVVARMKEPYLLNSGARSDYGRGLRRLLWRGQELYYHTGSNAGFRAVSLLAPGLDLRLAVLSNYGDSLPMQKALALLELCAPEGLAARTVCAHYRDEKLPLPEGLLICGRDLLRVARHGGEYRVDDGSQWVYEHARGNEYRCGANASLLYALPDGGLARESADGDVTVFRPAVLTAIPARERALAGYYFSGELLTFYRLFFEGDALLLEHLKSGVRTFRRVGPGRYAAMEGEGMLLTLEPGDAPAFTLDKERSQSLRFVRTDLPE